MIYSAHSQTSYEGIGVGTQRQPARKIRFGPYEADLSSEELRKGGIRLKLQPQPFHVLSLLLKRPGEVVSREELQRELWPKETYVEFDLSLNAVIKKLRRALNDNPQYPRYIETLPRNGYRFVCPVERIEIEPAPPPSVKSPPSETAPWWGVLRSHRSALTVGAILLGSVSLTGFLRSPSVDAFFGPNQRSEEQRAALRFARGSQVSPDGVWLAYRDAETANLWIRDLASGQKKLLVADWITSPVWSPDSRRIAYVKLGDPPRGLEIVDILTGERRPVPTEQGARTVPWDWSVDNRLLCTMRIDEDPRRHRIVLISPEDGTITPLREVAGANPRGLRLSPDQRFMAYERTVVSEQTGWRGTDIFLAPVIGDQEEVVISAHPDTEIFPFWSRDSKHILYIKTTRPNMSLWSVPIDQLTGGVISEPTLVTDLGRMTYALRPSSTLEGDIYISRETNGHFQAFLLKVDPETGSPKGEPKTDFPENTNPHHWSADGEWLGYVSINLGLSQKTTAQNLVERNLRTGEERLVPKPESSVTPRPWHYSEPSDGRWAVYAQRDTHEIFQKDLATGETTTLLTTVEPVSGLRSFKDGGEILFSTHSEGRDIHTMKILNLASGSQREVGISRVPRWSQAVDATPGAKGEREA